ADEEQVARLDVEVLQLVLLVHPVERLGAVAEVAEQVVARHADQAGVLALDVQVVQAAVGQLHDDDQLAGGDLDAVERADEGVADLLDALQGVEFLFSAGAVHVERVEVAVDELDGLEQAARRLALPDFAEAAAAQGLDQAIPGYRLGVRLPNTTHGSV